MASAVVCILLATVDVICCSIVSDLLKLCTYQEVYSGESPLDALTVISAAKTRVRIVLTNMNRIDAQMARDILYHIDQKIKLHTYFMSPNHQRFGLTRRNTNGRFVVYIINSFNQNSLSKFWRASSVSIDQVSKAIAMTSVSSSSLTSSSSPSSSPSPPASSSSSASPMTKDKKKDGASKRIEWTDELNRKFLKVIHSQDPKEITPIEIVKLMKVPWLSRRHVGSHLQKYRDRVKKEENASETTEMPSAPRQMRSAYTGFKSRSGRSQIQHSSYAGLKLTEGQRFIEVKGTWNSYNVLFSPAPLETPPPTTSEPVLVHEQPDDDLSWKARPE